MKRSLALTAALLLAACAQTSGVMDAGNGTYLISASSHTQYGGTPTAYKAAWKEAEKHCAQSGQKPVVVGTQQGSTSTGSVAFSPYGGGGGYGGMQDANLRFRCA